MVAGVISYISKVISQKVNVIARLQIELVYYAATIQHFSYYDTETLWRNLGNEIRKYYCY